MSERDLGAVGEPDALGDVAPIGRDDAACVIAWRVHGYEAIEVYVDPALADRAESICETVEALSGAHADVDTLSEAIETFADGEDLSASIYDRPEDTSGRIVAVAVTLG